MRRILAMVWLVGLSVAGAQAADVGNLYTERSRAALRQTKCDFSERHIVIANKMDKPLYVIVNYVIGDPVLSKQRSYQDTLFSVRIDAGKEHKQLVPEPWPRRLDLRQADGLDGFVNEWHVIKACESAPQPDGALGGLSCRGSERATWFDFDCPAGSKKQRAFKATIDKSGISSAWEIHVRTQ